MYHVYDVSRTRPVRVAVAVPELVSSHMIEVASPLVPLKTRWLVAALLLESV